MCALIFVPATHAGQHFITTESPAIGTIEERAVGLGHSLSDRVSNLGRVIDLFLARSKYTDKRNESHVNISQLVNWTEGGKVTTSTDFAFNLALPNVEKRWQLRFSSYDEDEESRDLNQRTIRTGARPRDPGAALFFFRKLGKVKTSFQPRLQLKDPLQVAYVARFELASDHTRLVRVEPRIELFADSTKGTGEFAAIVFVVKASQTSKWDFALENNEEYRQRLNFFTTRHGVTASYALSDTEGLGASVVATSENHNFHLASLNVGTSYSKVLYAQLLQYGISPYLAFGHGDHFHGHPGLTFSLELIF